MRLFKAFSLLHRRTKSETFIPGYIPSNQAFSNLNAPSRPSSLPAGLGSNTVDSSDISSIFDFATARFTPISANFNHLRVPITHVISRAISSPQRSGKDSQNTLTSILIEENMRLRDALNLWFSEYSKTDELLQQCRVELAVAGNKTQTLQLQITRDQELIRDLQKDICRYEKAFENLRNPGPSDRSRRQSKFLNDEPNTVLFPGSSDSAMSLVTSEQIRTLDEYTSALRMTLSTRRQLRDQKKVSKFWKNMALSANKFDDIITPSTSAISSVHDPLPPERKRAIDALMRERGWPHPYPSAELKAPVEFASSSERPFRASLSGDLSVSHIHPVSSIAATLISTSSNNSVGSRLAPLASESLKAEINMLFGIQSSENIVSSPPKHVPSSAILKTTVGSSSRLGGILRATFSFGSYGDLSQRLSNLFSQDHTPRVKLPVTRVQDNPVQRPGRRTESQHPVPSSSWLAETSASGSSRIFGEALALLQGQRDADMYLNFLPSDTEREDVIQPFKSTHRSWQKYIAPPTRQIPPKTGLPKKKPYAGKENVPLLSKPLSVLKKPSKIQNPILS